jgi:hypothetical protein
VLKKLKSVMRLWALTGNTLSYDSTKALIDRSLLEFRKLQERRRLLEEHTKPWCSEARYRIFLGRIEADQRRLLAKLKGYYARIDEIGAAAERPGLELVSPATNGMCEDRDESKSTKPRDLEAKTRAEFEELMRRRESLHPDSGNDDMHRHW